uniref:Uncharacterized protein n=1 Tax=Arundo donax TaxID=35708 RepID=A0A0A9DRP9_ARUDO
MVHRHSVSTCAGTAMCDLAYLLFIRVLNLRHKR